MRSHKPDKHGFDGELKDGHYPVIISLDVEYIPLVAYIIHGIERLFYIGKTCPLRMFHGLVPAFQGYFGIGILTVEVP